MSSSEQARSPRLTAVMRDGERVTSLELFFDLVFVLALTQCTALMARTLTWQGLGRALLVLCVLWWAWTGYAWLTSVVDPEEGSVRLVIFAAMAALLVTALCVPGAFTGDALVFAIAYGAVRAAHIGLFMLASRDDRQLRSSVVGLAGSTAVGVGLLLIAAFASGTLQIALWGAAIVLDMGGPFLFGAEGWKIVPAHFAERHGAIIIIAIGESIVAIGAGATASVDAGVVAAAVLGTAISAALWWLYFDVVSIVAERRLIKAAEGGERNEIARDSYSYIHLPMVAGIALIALGLKRSLADVRHPLGEVAAAAMFGGAALYLLAHVAFRWRNIHTLNRQRLACSVFLAAMFAGELAARPAALVSLAALTALLVGLIAYEALHFSELRVRLRHLDPIE